MEKIDQKFSELKKLMEEKDTLVKEGKYLEAEEIRQKILSIKSDSSSNKQDLLYSLNKNKVNHQKKSTKMREKNQKKMGQKNSGIR